MDARSLFVTVADAGSYAAASRERGVARTTVMRKVAALEEELGLSLVQVAGNTVVLTAAGHRLADAWRALLRQRERLEQEVRAEAGRLAGVLRVRLPVMGTAVGIVPAIAAFSRAHPEIEVQVQQGWEPRALQPGEFDVALRVGHHVDPAFHARKLFDVHHILVASPEYVARWGLPDSPDDLPRHRSIQEWDAAGRLVPWRGPDGRRVQPPPVAVRAHGVGHVIGFALGGAGIACVPDALALPAIDQGLLVRVLPSLHAADRVSLVFLPEPSPTSRAFIDFVLARLADRGRPLYDPTHLVWR